MIFQDQLIIHDPDNKQYGDCFRAVLATLLHKETQEVPHFLWDNCDSLVFNTRVNEYLGTINCCFLATNVFNVEEWKVNNGITKDIYHEISDRSPRFSDTLHSVVGCNGRVIHDPHPDRIGFPEETVDRRFGFILNLNERSIK